MYICEWEERRSHPVWIWEITRPSLSLNLLSTKQAAMLGRLDSLMQFAPGLGAAGGGGMGLAAQGQFDDAEDEGAEGVNGHNGDAGGEESPQ